MVCSVVHYHERLHITQQKCISSMSSFRYVFVKLLFQLISLTLCGFRLLSNKSCSQTVFVCVHRFCLITFTVFCGFLTIRRPSRDTSAMMMTVPCPVRGTCPTWTSSYWTRYRNTNTLSFSAHETLRYDSLKDQLCLGCFSYIIIGSWFRSLDDKCMSHIGAQLETSLRSLLKL